MINNKQLPQVLGITGGIGSGKSVVSRILSIMGIPVYDCDREAKRLNETDLVIRKGLIELVGEQVYDSDGKLNKVVLASFLFASSSNATQVNAIIHPRVKEDFLRWKAIHKQTQWVGIESAIIYESGISDLADKILTVMAPEEVRISRVVRRDKASCKAVQLRMAQQMSEEEHRMKSQFLLENDGRRALIPQILDILAFLLCPSRS